MNKLDGWNKSVEGAEKLPKDNSCVEAGILTVGDGFLEITRVAFKSMEPDASFAVIPMGTPVTVSGPASSTEVFLVGYECCYPMKASLAHLIGCS